MGAWTDIYALGSVMCRAITGEKPPVAADRLMDDDFVWLSNRGLSGFDEQFLIAVDWALRVRPEERPQQIPHWEPHLQSRADSAVYASPTGLPTEFIQARETPPELPSEFDQVRHEDASHIDEWQGSRSLEPESSSTERTYKAHHGILVLCLGLLGLIVCQPVGIVAWVIGNSDLKQISAGTMNPKGKALVQIGKILGIIAVVLLVIGIFIAFLSAVLGVK